MTRFEPKGINFPQLRPMVVRLRRKHFGPGTARLMATMAEMEEISGLLQSIQDVEPKGFDDAEMRDVRKAYWALHDALWTKPGLRRGYHWTVRRRR